MKNIWITFGRTPSKISNQEKQLLTSSSNFHFSDINPAFTDLIRLSLYRWGLSNRTLNSLLRFNFKMTVGDLFSLDNDFNQIRGLGDEGRKELQSKLLLLMITAETQDKPYNSEAIASFKTLSQESLLVLRNVPLDWLHLDRQTHKALLAAGLTNIADLYYANESFIGGLQGYHPDSLGDINHKFVSLLNSIDENSHINWFKYWEDQKITVLPTNSTLNELPMEIIKNFNPLLEEIFRQEQDVRIWHILKRRYGLAGESKLTLEEMGTAFGLTRERIRQLEAKALNMLRSIILFQQYAGKTYHIHPSVETILLSIYEIVNLSQFKCCLEEDLFIEFQIRWGQLNEIDKNIMYLFLDLLKIQHLEFNCSGIVPAWGILGTEGHKILERAVNKINNLLTKESALPCTELDTLIYLNKGALKSEVFKLSQIPEIVELCVSVEKREDGLLWGLFPYLDGRGNQVERLLLEEEHPLNASELSREINHRLVPLGKSAVTETNLRNQIIGDKRFTPIGHSGKWRLSTWEHIDTKNILTLMKDFLIARNSPATIDEIYEYVSGRRPVKKNSIITYLSMGQEDFIKTSQSTWGLAQWTDTKSNRKRKRTNKRDGSVYQQMIVEVRDILNKAPQKQMLKTNLIQELRKRLECSEVTLYNYTSKLEIIENLGEGRKKICRLIENANLRDRRTTREKIADTVKNLLETSPEKQLPLKEIIAHLENIYDNPKHTLYQYVGHLDFIEQVESINPIFKTYRLKSAQAPIQSLATQPVLPKLVSTSLVLPEQQMGTELVPTDKELKIFYCYAREDQALREKLERYLAHLKRQYRFSTWFDRQVLPGDIRHNVIEEHLREADLIFLLISPDFMASDYCYDKEMQYALDRHAKGEASVIPIILRPTFWDGAPFSHIQMLPTDSVPVTRWKDLDEAFQDIVIGINRTLQTLLISRKENK